MAGQQRIHSGFTKAGIPIGDNTDEHLSSSPAFSVISNQIKLQLECGPMPNVMAALPNIGGALCSTPQSLADAHSAVQ